MNKAYIDKDGNLQDLPQSDINEILKGYVECALWTEQERLEDDATMDVGDDGKLYFMWINFKKFWNKISIKTYKVVYICGIDLNY